MKLTTFSNISPEEFFQINQGTLPAEVLKYLDDYSKQIEELQQEVKGLSRNNELAWEQVSFARDLVESLDHFAEFNLSKAKKVVYNQIRENTYFEV